MHFPRGGHLYFRLDIIRVKGLSKRTLNTYFLGMKIDPKYAFLQAFYLICLQCTFQNLSICPKTHPFFSKFARFCTPKRCTRVHCLVLKNNPNYVNFFYADDIQLQIQVAPPPGAFSQPFWCLSNALTFHICAFDKIEIKISACVRYFVTIYLQK